MNKIKKITLVSLFFLFGVFTLQAQTTKFSLTTSHNIGQPLALTLNYGATVSIDWGDGNLIQYTSVGDSITGTLKGSTVTVDGTDITLVECSNQGLTTLNVTELSDLCNLSCHNNELQSLDISKNNKLLKLNCAFNKLTTLSLTGIPVLTELIINNNQINTLGLTATTKYLKTLICNNNNINTLNLTYLTALKTLWCQDNILTSLNASKCTTLETLICYNNQITALNITGLTLLTDLWCDSNRFSDLNLSTNTALNYLSANNSTISKLTLSTPFSVKSLYLNENNLGYAGLPSVTGITNYKYAPQNPVSIPGTIDTNTTLDLSTQLTTANHITTNATFKWKEGQITLVAGDDYTENNGIFTFKKGFRAAYCEISSSIFPELPTITTTTTAVNVAAGIEENQMNQSLILFTREGKLIINSTFPQTINIYTLTGLLIKSTDNMVGIMEISLPKGAYIVNNKKVVL